MPRRTQPTDADTAFRAGVLALLPLSPDSPEVAPLVETIRETVLLVFEAQVKRHGQVLITIHDGVVETVEGTTSTRKKVRRDPIPLRRPS